MYYRSESRIPGLVIVHFVYGNVPIWYQGWVLEGYVCGWLLPFLSCSPSSPGHVICLKSYLSEEPIGHHPLSWAVHFSFRWGYRRANSSLELQLHTEIRCPHRLCELVSTLWGNTNILHHLCCLFYRRHRLFCKYKRTLDMCYLELFPTHILNFN